MDTFKCIWKCKNAKSPSSLRLRNPDSDPVQPMTGVQPMAAVTVGRGEMHCGVSSLPKATEG